jgi:capsular polysaccharide transport system permease protein
LAFTGLRQAGAPFALSVVLPTLPDEVRVETGFSTASPQVPASPGPRRRFASVRTVAAMMLREMVTTYGRSPGGYIWAILEPVAAIALLSLAFSLAFAKPSLGTSFPLFYATAYLPYMLFHDVGNKVATSLSFSKPLMAYPAVTYVDAILARFLLNLVTHVMVFAIVMSGIVATLTSPVIIDLPAMLNALGMAAALGLGIGTLNCYLMLAFPAWERIWQILTRPLFILSGVFFLYEDVPTEFQGVLWYNPLYHITGAMRDAFYATYDAAYVSPAYVYGIAAVTFAVGLMALRNSHSELLL